ncbi:MAG: DUF72 domain-containing protein [Phycisphaerae bacterium]|nr:DUF72 domain-containing protein [Phycisphaerae bacterium]
MPPAKCHIGTSGWSYAHWAKGRFYPKGLKQTEWLAFFARQFDTVEVNMSFYRLPKPEMVARWGRMTGSRFRFAIKLWRRITHEKRLADCGAELGDFFAVLNLLGSKRGPLLVQLPPSMRKDVGRLDTFLTEQRKAAGRSRWKVAVEFRNTDWLCEEVCTVLDRHGAGLCLADLPQCPITRPNDAAFVYMRRHGPGGSYRGCYTPRHVAADAGQIRGWLESDKEVFVYYNNDINGHAVDNARQLLKAIEASKPGTTVEPSDTPQKDRGPVTSGE